MVIAHSTSIEGLPLYRCLDKRVIRSKENYGTIKTMEDTVLNRHPKQNGRGWITAIAMTRFTRRPEMDGFSVNEKKKYGSHNFIFSLIYEQSQRENDVEIEMHGNYVTPKDPLERFHSVKLTKH